MLSTKVASALEGLNEYCFSTLTQYPYTYCFNTLILTYVSEFTGNTAADNRPFTPEEDYYTQEEGEGAVEDEEEDEELESELQRCLDLNEDEEDDEEIGPAVQPHSRGGSCYY